MTTRRGFRPVKAATLSALALVLLGATAPAFGQGTLAEARMRKMEAEIRALQRQVFPGGGAEGKLFTPEITPARPAQGGAVAAPTTTPVTDLLTRMDSVEAQIARLTAQVEQTSNRLTQLEARVGPAAEAAATPGPTVAEPAAVAVASTPAAKPATAPARAAEKPAAPSAQRLAAVRAIEKPATNDAGDDEYSYGFRLWDAKFYPEAQQQLKMFIDRYPSHWRISYARNLLGRAYLDDGKPRDAASWFLQNYPADKTGARAPDSLVYLAEAMRQLKDTNRACIALAEFSETFAAEAAGRLKSEYDATRNGVKCGK
jgi:TolA-binding protein